MTTAHIDGTDPNVRRLLPSQAVALCRFAKACCPQQQFDEYTPDAWGELLADLRFEDCKEALTRVARRQPFVSPAEIRAEVKKIRFARIDAFGPFDPPREMEGNVKGYSEWIRAMNRRIADGELTREQYDRENAIESPRETPALEGVFRDATADDPWETA